MRKIVLVLIMLTVLTVGNLFSLGIGGAFSLDLLESATSGPALSIKLDNVDPLLGISLAIGGDSFALGVTADWWMYRAPLVGIISMYAGPGAFVNIASTNNNALIDLGVRIPVGFQVFLIDPLELFVEIAPRMGVQFSDPIQFPSWGVQGAFGFRFWF